MTSHHKIACFLLLFLLSLPAWGQYTTTYALSGVDVLNSAYAPPTSGGYNCVSNNCFNRLTVSAIFTYITVSPDSGELQAIDDAYNRWRWIPANNAWTELHDGIPWKEMHIGSFANNQYLGISTSNVPYYWSGSAWVRLGATVDCDTGDVNAEGDYFCINNGEVLWWKSGSTSWTEISASLGGTISANQSGALLVQTQGYVYVWDIDQQTWTRITGLGFTPSHYSNAVGFADDGTVAMLDTSGNLHVSHDGGATWTAPTHTGITMQAVAHSAAANTFTLTNSGEVYHFNVLVPQTSMSIAGTCGSACGSGNPALVVSYQSTDPGVHFSCPNGPWVFWTIGVVDCGFNTNADTVLNTPLASSFAPGCDYFSPGSGDGARCTQTLSIFVALGSTLVFQSNNDCGCEVAEVDVNQKYFVNNNFNQAPTSFWWGLSSLLGTYQWKGTSLTQNCMGTFLPDLGEYGSNVTILYKLAYPKPTKMPGRYVNGDVYAVLASDGLGWGVALLAGKPTLAVYAKHGYPGHIYTWDNDSLLRGPGGSPTLICGGGEL